MNKNYPWVLVALLSVVALLNYMDRQMLATMKPSMQLDIAELQTAANFGRLMAVFLWIYGFMSPIAGMIGDKVNRKWLIIGSLFVWSGVTFAMGYATTFDQLYGLRAMEKLVFVHPYDDPRIIAGQGTIALEMLADAPTIDTLVVPVGGGGMLAGCAVAARGLKPDARLIGVESAGYSAMRQLLAGETVSVGGDTIAEGIAVRDIGQAPLAIARALVDRVLTVDEVAIERAIALFLEVEKTVAEGAGAAGLAALLAHPEVFAGRTVGLILCGGNIDTRLLASVLLRGLVRDGRIVRLRLMIPDLPGQLARVAGLIGGAGGNIVEVQHQRLFGSVVAKSTELDVTVESRDRDHARELVAALQAEGFKVRVLEGADA